VELGDREPNPDAWPSIERAADGHSTSMEDVPFDYAQDRGVDHRRPYVLVSEQFLHGTDVIASFKHVGSEAVAEGVATHSFVEASQLGCLLNRLLHAAFVK